MPGLLLIEGAHQLGQVPAAAAQQGMAFGAVELPLDVLAEHLEVLQHQQRLGEHPRVQPLQHRWCALGVHQIGVVHIAVAQGRNG